MRKAALEKQAEEEKNRSFIMKRKSAPLERRAALFGFIYSENDSYVVEDLMNTLRAILYAWQDQAHTDVCMRRMERLVKFRHKRALMFQMLRIWIGRCSATTHRLALWISKRFAKNSHKRLAMSQNEVATKHLIAQYAALDLGDMIDVES